MIICSLASLMAARKLNISDVSRDTGISRTTLTALYHNEFKGIQCSTLNALCRYFNTTTDKLLMFSRYDFDIKLIYSETTDNGGTELFTLEITAADGAVKNTAYINGAVYIYGGGREAEIYADEYADPANKAEREGIKFVKKALSSLSGEFKSYVNEIILKCVSAALCGNMRITSFRGV